jgi:hypothetical protein
MKKTITIDKFYCDFEKEGIMVEAVGKVFPSDKDACKQHLDALKKEIKLPKEIAGESSGIFIALDPDYTSVQFNLKAK